MAQVLELEAKKLAIQIGAKLRPMLQPERHSEAVEEIYNELVHSEKQR